MAFGVTWDAAFEALPADGDAINEGAERIRDLKDAVQERMDADHYWDPAGTDASHGQHRQIQFYAPIATPTDAAGTAFLYGKDVSAKIELHWLDEDGNEVQLTFAGAAGIPAGEIIYFYADTAPAGFTIYNTVVDCVLALKGGGNAYDDTGGDGAEKGTWQQPDCTLTAAESGLPAHEHTYNYRTASHQPYSSDVHDGWHGVGGTSTSGGTAQTAAEAHDHGIVYRPLAALGILATKD